MHSHSPTLNRRSDQRVTPCRRLADDVVAVHRHDATVRPPAIGANLSTTGSRSMRNQPRPRRPVSALRITVLRPLFRYSPGRGAYVLRIVGGRFGPVLTHRQPSERRGNVPTG